MSEFLNTRVGDIHSGPLLSLIDELENSVPVGSRHFVAGLHLFHFLTQCVYPQGAGGKRVPIRMALAIHTPILESKVGKLPNGDLRNLCVELALRNNTALEFYSGNKLAVFLNKTLPTFPLSKRPSAKKKRFDAVAMRRRANRG